MAALHFSKRMAGSPRLLLRCIAGETGAEDNRGCLSTGWQGAACWPCTAGK